MAENREHYDGINGLKAYAIVGIILMHVLANGEYKINGFIFERVIPSFTSFVFLFMIVSSYGMCCGYYQKIIDQEISVEDFYLKRYHKIWPFFAALCVLDLCISPSKESTYEVFANLTLCQGLLPNAEISVIGVSWTLAVIFVFYMLFPFFCFIITYKKRAWIAALVAYVLNYLCIVYFNADRRNIIFDAIYFIAGGIIYKYRKEICFFQIKYRIIVIFIFIISIITYCVLGDSTFTTLFAYSSALIYAIGCKKKGIFNNRVVKFISEYCFELYLCHMVIFRGLDKFHLIRPFENGIVSYALASIMVIGGAIVFSFFVRKVLNKKIIKWI